VIIEISSHLKHVATLTCKFPVFLNAKELSGAKDDTDNTTGCTSY